MSNPLSRTSWSPYFVGAGIGILSWFAFWTADHPIGLTTAFEHAAALAARSVLPQVDQTNPYFTDNAATPAKIGWEWMLVIGIFLGALCSARLSGDTTRKKIPSLWAARFGPDVAVRFLAAVVGGAVMMFGARLAGGCTSGHGISGALQLALSSWIFFPTFFLAGIATALLLYGRKGPHHV